MIWYHRAMIWKPHVTVAAVVERDNRFLLVEEYADNPNRTVFNQPAGHLEKGESIIEAVIRETLEETAWQFTPTALVGIYRWPHPQKDLTYLRFAFTGTVTGHNPVLSLDDGIVGTAWKTRDEIEALGNRLRSPQVLRGIDDYLAGHRTPLDIFKDLD